MDVAGTSESRLRSPAPVAPEGQRGRSPGNSHGNVSPALRRPGQWAGLPVALFISFLLFGLTYFSDVHYSSSDPYLSPLLAQAILEHGTTKLDAYQSRTEPPLEQFDQTSQVLRWKGHYYYYPPPGPSLVSLPLVAVANLAGASMTEPGDIFQFQEYASSLLVALIFLTFYLISAYYLPRREALVLSLVIVMGSSLVSTIGTALWNVGFSTLFISLALLLLVRYDTRASRTPHPYALGFMLCAAYLSRPTAAVFIVVVFAYLLLKAPRLFLACALAALVPLLLFILYSLLEFGQWLPPYYDAPARVAASTARYSQWQGIQGVLFSPGRGLIPFSPFVLPVAAGALILLRPLAWRPLFWPGLLWFAAHILVVASATRWWGGHAFGPRILTDAMPALLLITLLVWQEARDRLPGGGRVALAGLFLVLGGWSIFVHSYQGLYNPYTGMWNYFFPDIDREPEYILDWRYPQFLASNDLLCARNETWVEEEITTGSHHFEPYHIGETIRYDLPANNAVFSGWFFPEGSFRWSVCERAKVFFRLSAEGFEAARRYTLVIRSGAFDEQRASVSLNGEPLATWLLNGIDPGKYTVDVDGSLLKAGELNYIEFALPDARPRPSAARYPDTRHFGMALSEIWFRIASSP